MSTQKLSNNYQDVYFVKFYGNSSDETKDMFKNRLKARVTPTFYFFRDGTNGRIHNKQTVLQACIVINVHRQASALPHGRQQVEAGALCA